MSDLNTQNKAQEIFNLFNDFLEVQRANSESLTVNEVIANFEALFSSMSPNSNPSEASNTPGAKIAAECQAMFNEIGKLTRIIHDSIEQFNISLSPAINSLLDADIPDTASKIEYALELSEKSTHTVLSELEKQSEIISTQEQKTKELFESISNGLAEPKSILQALTSQSNFLATLNDSNTAILVSQSHQDLSGQVLKKVITLISSVEKSLLSMLLLFGKQISPDRVCLSPTEDLSGPSVDGCSQGDVDDLLSSLGF